MLCPSCRRQVVQGSSHCGACGVPVADAAPPFEVVLPDGTRVPVTEEITVGSAPGSTLQIAAATVSRRHARIVPGGGAEALIEDAGSTHGTFVDGRRIATAERLHDGSRIRIGDHELLVGRQHGSAGSGRSLVVREGASLIVPTAGGSAKLASAASQFGVKPRVRSGYALKRLERDAGARRWILRDLGAGASLRLSDNDAQLFELLDGEHALIDLIGEAERRFGPTGPARLAQLLADLGDRGYLADVVPATQDLTRHPRRPREMVLRGADMAIERLYRAGGWVLFLRPVGLLACLLAAASLWIFLSLIAQRYGTPFIVAGKVVLGVFVFLLASFVVVGVVELVRGLTLASFGRRVHTAGLRWNLWFPYPYVDTSESSFESRGRRMAISAAGPLSALAIGAIFALSCMWVGDGSVRDMLFQFAFVAYVVALLDLNPFVDRGGYHLLVDMLREPRLRPRARDELRRRLSGRGRQTDRPVAWRYAGFALVWAVLVNLMFLLALRYDPILQVLLPSAWLWVERALLAALWLVFFLPAFVSLGQPLLDRVRGVRPAR